jgi:hypothetical protein
VFESYRIFERAKDENHPYLQQRKIRELQRLLIQLKNDEEQTTIK